MRHAKLGDLQRALGLFLPLTISLPFTLRRLSQVSREPVSILCLMLIAKKERKKERLNNSRRPTAQRPSIHYVSCVSCLFLFRVVGVQQFTTQRTHIHSHTHTWRLFEPVFMLLGLRRKLEEKPQTDSEGRCKPDTEGWN